MARMSDARMSDISDASLGLLRSLRQVPLWSRISHENQTNDNFTAEVPRSHGHGKTEGGGGGGVGGPHSPHGGRGPRTLGSTRQGCLPDRGGGLRGTGSSCSPAPAPAPAPAPTPAPAPVGGSE